MGETQNYEPLGIPVDTGRSPRDYGVPHDEWRDNQAASLNHINAILEGKEKAKEVVLEIPTGGGKSALPAALGYNHHVTVLVHSLGLLDQYEKNYGFAVVKGQQNYECVNPDVIQRFSEKQNRFPTAADCPYEKKSHCPFVEECPYVQAREKAMHSMRMACTYPYALVSPQVPLRRGILIADESHVCAESIINHSTIEFTTKTITDWRLPQFPMGVYGTKDALDERRRKILSQWLRDCLRAIGPPPPKELADDLSSWNAIKRRLDFALSEIEERWDNYYLECSAENYWSRGKEKKREYLRLKPFTAARYSGKLTAGKDLSILMSATIGDPRPLAEELGLEDYRAFSYPHPIPPAFRPVYDLRLPRMTYDNLNKTKALPAIQASKIYDFIARVPANWRGVVLTSSYAKLKTLREHLERKLGRRIYVPPNGGGPAERIAGFLQDQRDGLIAVDLIESWGTGLDLVGDLARFVVIAGIPFPNFQNDPFARARSQKNGAGYLWWSAYTSVVQAAGRVVRGEQDERGNYLPNIAVLADGSATSPRALGTYPQYFRDAIKPF